MLHDLLIELGCADLPAALLPELQSAFAEGFIERLTRLGLKFNAAKIKQFSTPRRLALFVPELESKTRAESIERRGPAKAVAFSASGEPTQALLGFLKSAQAELADLIEVETDKGIWLALKIEKPAQCVKELLPDMLTEVLKKLPMKKPMRWGAHAMSFIRPVQWLLMLYGDEVIPATAFGLQAGRLTYGHRFMCPAAISIKRPTEYESKLLAAKVVANQAMRCEMIEKEVKKLLLEGEAARLNCLAEVVNLVEWPKAVLAHFNPEFLKVPDAALISSMETNQKVLPILDPEGRLAPKFIAISNIESKNMAAIISGNEKVVRARLADAEFFYEADLKTALASTIDKLAQISFQEGLGALADKVGRLECLAEALVRTPEISNQLPYAAVADALKDARQAASLCKADLVSHMVQEFPELQGIMGREYALVEGISLGVADAIEDHYRPKGRGGALPRAAMGGIIALADKLDTLVGIFGIGQKPSSSGDPYALRRQAIGIISVVIHFNWPLDLMPILKQSVEAYRKQGFALLATEVLVAELSEFLLERMEQWCKDEQGDIEAKLIRAVKNWIRGNPQFGLNPVVFYQNLQALKQKFSTAAGVALIQDYKRAKNIIPDAWKRRSNPEAINYEQHLSEPAEIALNKQYKLVAKAMPELVSLRSQQFLAAYDLLLTLSTPLADFFATVRVEVEALALKNSRITLLQNIVALFQILADFSSL